MSFDALGLAPELLRAVTDQGYTEPTPVQREAIPLVLAGRDLLAGAQTGTGKTAAFVLPILQTLAGRPPRPASRPNSRPPVRVLVLTPTRELALQVEQSVRTYGAQHRFRSAAIYGGVGFEPQVRALRAGPPIVVATPGRLLDHVGQGTIDLSTVEILVLDEADRMLDMGFIRDIRRVLDLLPADRQNLLFSATFSDEIRRLAGGLLQNPATVQVTPRNTATQLVTQLVIPVDRERKRELLSSLVRSGRIDQALVFTRTKHGANRLAEQLARDGIAATAIHGNKSQGQRVRALDDFKRGRASILVATEVASRGLDIEELPHVINFELPMVPEDYVHRIGRTGRAGSTGDAISLVCVDEGPLLRDIEQLLGNRIPTEIVPGFEPDRSIRPEPILRRGGGQHGGRSGGQPRPGGFAGPRRDRTGGGATYRRPEAPRPSAAPSGPGQRDAHGGFAAAGRPRPNQRPDGRPAQPGRNRPWRDGADRQSPNRGVGIGNAPSGRPGPRPAQSRPSGPPRHGAPSTLPGERIARQRPDGR
jgi:ATP-dependent RNA helicase RhlE